MNIILWVLTLDKYIFVSDLRNGRLLIKLQRIEAFRTVDGPLFLRLRHTLRSKVNQVSLLIEKSEEINTLAMAFCFNGRESGIQRRFKIL